MLKDDHTSATRIKYYILFIYEKKKGKVEIRFDRRVAIVVVESGVNFFSSGTSLYATAHIQTFVLLQRRKRDLGKEKKKSNKSRRSRSHTLGRRPSYTPVSDRKKNINKKKETCLRPIVRARRRGFQEDTGRILVQFFFYLLLWVRVAGSGGQPISWRGFWFKLLLPGR